MTVWTREQITQVRTARSVAWLSPEMLARMRDEALHAMAERLFQALRETCHPFGVEIHPEDVELMREEEDLAVRFTARWNPKTLATELVGGPQDGLVVTVQDLQTPVRAHGAMTPSRMYEQAILDEVLPVTQGIYTYELDGWNEATREWVHRVRVP